MSQALETDAILCYCYVMQGTILCGSNNFFAVECADKKTRSCSIKGKKLTVSRDFYNPLAPGDCVKIETDLHNDEKGQIIAVIPRKNVFVRWNVKGRAPQLLAANLDYLMCVTTPDFPPFRPRFVDRMLIQADAAHITPIIVCNKSDLPFSTETEFRLNDWERLGYTVLRISAMTGENLPHLAALLKNNLCAFVGQSGVGKSTIINALDAQYNLKTGVLSQKYERGTHTTTQGILCRLTIDGVQAGIIDTPGVRRFVLDDIEAADLIYYFREIAPLAGTCAFGMSCTHTHETGCKILDAVQIGEMCKERYESWQRLTAEITDGSWAD